MTDKNLNYNRLWSIDKEVSLASLKEVFECIWNKKYPTYPWKRDAKSVQILEAMVKKENKKVKIPADPSGNWCNYVWDTSKTVYALVDSKLFHSELSVTDDVGKPVSEHIADMRKMRNKIAHLTSCVFEDDEFSLLTDLITSNLKALELLKLKQFDASKFIRKLQYIKSQKEKERFEAFIVKVTADKKYFRDKFLELGKSNYETEKNDEDASMDELAKTHIELDSDFDHLNMVICDIERDDFGDIEKVKSKIEYLETITEDINIKYSNKINRISSINTMRKELTIRIEILQSENKDLKDKLTGLRGDITQLQQRRKHLWLSQVMCGERRKSN